MCRIATTLAWIGLFVLAAGAPAGALSPQDVVGTWKLLTSVRQAVGSDKIVDNIGPHPNGILVITAEGRFIIIETAEGRKPATTTEELAGLQKTEIAYSGLITLSPDTEDPRRLKMLNRVDIAWNEEWVGTEQSRFLSLDADRLTIKTSPMKNPISGELAVATLVFERTK
jgi:hypothetical protein